MEGFLSTWTGASKKQQSWACLHAFATYRGDVTQLKSSFFCRSFFLFIPFYRTLGLAGASRHGWLFLVAKCCSNVAWRSNSTINTQSPVCSGKMEKGTIWIKQVIQRAAIIWLELDSFFCETLVWFVRHVQATFQCCDPDEGESPLESIPGCQSVSRMTEINIYILFTHKGSRRRG